MRFYAVSYCFLALIIIDFTIFFIFLGIGLLYVLFSFNTLSHYDSSHIASVAFTIGHNWLYKGPRGIANGFNGFKTFFSKNLTDFTLHLSLIVIFNLSFYCMLLLWGATAHKLMFSGISYEITGFETDFLQKKTIFQFLSKFDVVLQISDKFWIITGLNCFLWPKNRTYAITSFCS